MKKYTYLLLPCLFISFLFFTSISSFGQSVTILPERQSMDNSLGDNIKIYSNSEFIGLQSFRYNGTSLSKSGVLTNNDLFRIGGGGYFSSSGLHIEKAGIFFRASQDWAEGASGTSMGFLTTANNTTTLVERMSISNAGNIGIANLNPTAKLHINHLATGDSPHLQLNSTGFGPSIIATTSTTGSMWLNYFLNGSTAGSNIVYWTTSISGATPLTLTGEGDAFVERNASVGGYTNLGSTAPKIKMMELNLTTSTEAGGVAYISHGLTLSKILSVSIMVNSSVGHDYPPGYGSTTAPGFQYFYFVTTTSVVIENSMSSYTNIANRPARILITYKE